MMLKEARGEKDKRHMIPCKGNVHKRQIFRDTKISVCPGLGGLGRIGEWLLTGTGHLLGKQKCSTIDRGDGCTTL